MSARVDESIEHSALLVVDAQESFRITPRWEQRSNLDFEHNVDLLVQAYRRAGLPVFFILHTDEDPGFTLDSPDFRLMDFLLPRSGEPVLIKNTRNAFTSTDLEERLQAAGVRRLAITGIQTEQCCETTARVAADLGYDVDFVIDATMTFPIRDQETGDELGTDEIVRRTEFVLRGRFARIAKAAALARTVEAAGTPAAAVGGAITTKA